MKIIFKFTEGLIHWKVQHGGNDLIVEDRPIGSDPVPEEASPTQHCFVTSYMRCIRSQTIRLEKIGVSPWVMDNIKPDIYVCEWYDYLSDYYPKFFTYIVHLSW